MGRPRKPTALKIATGTHRKDRHGDPDAEPKGNSLKVNDKPPVKLDKFELATWKALLAVLVPKNLATDMDVQAIVDYARDCRLAQRLRDMLKTDGLVLATEKGFVSHPGLTSLNQIRSRMTTFESRFGMTPSDRAGMDLSLSDGKSRGVQSRKRGG